jgi:hypothetical protein
MTNPATPPQPLTPSGIRAVAASMAATAVPNLLPHTATVMIDALDALSRALLVQVIGLAPIEAMAIQSYLWSARLAGEEPPTD